MKHFNNVTSLEDLKKQYRKLALANHPDKGGRTEVMQEINIEFDVLFKVWKDKITDSNEQPTSETASEYRKNFYTANGWEGSRYDHNLSTKDVAARVREYVKMQWPQYKFSIRTQYYSGGSAIHLTLVSGPEKAFKDGATRTYISTMRNVEGFEKDLTEIVFHVISDVCDFMQSYNYDDSDGMIDYFDTNFYSHIYIGDWDKPYEVKTAKPARIKEREENKETNKNGEIEIVDYSEKAVAVFGNTKSIKDDLKQLRGRFNPALKYNDGKRAGWVFPKSKREELESLLKEIDTNEKLKENEESYLLENIHFTETDKFNGVHYYDIDGAGVITKAKVRETLKKGDVFNVYTDDERKYGVTYDGVSLNNSLYNDLPEITRINNDIDRECISTGNDNKTITEQPNDKEERTTMSPADFMTFASCVQNISINEGYIHARNHVKEKLKQYRTGIAQLKYIVFLLSEYRERNVNEIIGGAA